MAPVLRTTSRACAIWSVLAGLVASPLAHADTLPPLVLIRHGAPSAESSAAELAISESERYRLVSEAALIPLMRQRDRDAALSERSAKLTEQGRKALVGMDNQGARERFLEAAAVLEGGFVRYYDPTVLAQVYVLVGVAAMQMARPDLARDGFVKALHLDPKLELDAHYSPQVREAFKSAAAKLPERPVPPANDAARIATLGQAKHAVVVAAEALAGGSISLQALVLSAERKAYTKVETQLINAGDRPAARAFGARLKAQLEPLFPKPKAVVVNGGGKGNGKKLPPPPPPPWYKRWYTLAAAGAIVAAAIIVPLAARSESVDVTARW